MKMDVRTAVILLQIIEAQLTDEAMLQALRLVCNVAMFGDMDKEPCEACFDGVYITDTTPTYAGREHPYCAECGRALCGPNI